MIHLSSYWTDTNPGYQIAAISALFFLRNASVSLIAAEQSVQFNLFCIYDMNEQKNKTMYFYALGTQNKITAYNLL